MILGRLALLIVGGLCGGAAWWAVSTAALAAEDVFGAMRGKAAMPPAPAPDLVLPTADGGSLRLAELRGKVVLLGFFSTT